MTSSRRHRKPIRFSEKLNFTDRSYCGDLGSELVGVLRRLMVYGFPMRQETLGREAVAELRNAQAVDLNDDGLVEITESGVNTLAVEDCRSPSHGPGQCWGLVDDCPLCGTPHCYEDGCADAADDTFPNICDTCAQGAEFDDA